MDGSAIRRGLQCAAPGTLKREALERPLRSVGSISICINGASVGSVVNRPQCLRAQALFPGAGSAMRTAGPTTRAAFPRLEILDCALDSAVARRFLFGRDDPTNPFVSRQRRQIPPSRPRRGSRAEGRAHIFRYFVHGSGFSLVLYHHPPVSSCTSGNVICGGLVRDGFNADGMGRVHTARRRSSREWRSGWQNAGSGRGTVEAIGTAAARRSAGSRPGASRFPCATGATLDESFSHCH